MSLGYAEKLSFREDLGGQLGAAEHYDSPEEVERKVEQLAELVRQAKRIVAFTGAGISTACGIPDFRGPNGIWTLQRAGRPLPRPKVGFAHARPSLTHQALLALMEGGKLTYLVSQNVDGLHLRSGVPRARIAELHGNCFAERCARCETEYIRDFEIETVGFKRTGRRCSQPGCGGALVDHILDWEDELPPDELELSEKHAAEADLAICLGTSLQITPVCNLPLRATRTYKSLGKDQPGKLVIVNLQKTQHDNKAAKSGGLVIHARCDEVMALLARKLGMELPSFRRQDAVVVGHQQHAAAGRTRAGSGRACQSEQAPGQQQSASGAPAAERGGTGSASSSGSAGARGSDASGGASHLNGGTSGMPFTVYIRSTRGPKCPMPMVDSVDFEFEAGSGLAPASTCDPPFEVRRTTRRPGPCQVCITLHLHETADPDRRTVRINYRMDLQPPARGRGGGERLVAFETQVVQYGAGGAGGAAAAAAHASGGGGGGPLKREGEAAAALAPAPATESSAEPLLRQATADSVSAGEEQRRCRQWEAATTQEAKRIKVDSTGT